MRELETAKEVFDALGGISSVAEATGRKYKAVANWKSFNRFPANTYLALQNALKRRGVSASPALWGMNLGGGQ
jgi:hypothetical protein